MAIIASIGFLAAMFDLTYIPWRDFYFRNIPQVVQIYDPIKGIENHRETDRYLNAVEQLKSVVQTNGLASPETASWLDELDILSVSLIQSNPFQVAGKTGNLEKIKNAVRDRVHNHSAKGAFRTFWSQPYLIKFGWENEIAFYEQKIKPLIVTNYYRRLDESGNLVDLFWQIDIVFIGIFAGELLGRIFYIRRHNRNVTWQQAMIWRWYDLILLLPFFRFLRAIPVLIRWHQSKLVNLDAIQSELNRLFVGQIITEITDAVVIQIMEQTQSAIRRGQITKLMGDYIKRPHIDLNNVNEVEEIFQLVLEVVVYRVIPKVQPDLEAIFQHLFHQALLESPGYRNLQMLPGVGSLPATAIDRVVKEVSASLYSALLKVISDPDTGKLSHQFAETLTQSIGSEMQRGQTIVKIESLLYDLIEEIKVTYSRGNS